jgi:ABC-type uncharacterized transport system permease subunit
MRGARLFAILAFAFMLASAVFGLAGLIMIVATGGAAFGLALGCMSGAAGFGFAGIVAALLEAIGIFGGEAVPGRRSRQR